MTARVLKFLVLIFGCAMTLQASEIHNAVLRGDLKATQEALKSDPKKIASLDSDGNSPLHLACEKGNKELIDVLLLAGADVNAINSKKATALHRLISSPDDDPAAIGILFSKAAAIEAKNSDNETALFMACRLDKVKTARFLVEKGAYVNVRRGRCPGWTPLYAAAVGSVNAEYTDQQRVGFVKIIDMLIRNGADFRAQCGHRQETAYDYIAVAADGGDRNDSAGAQNLLASFMGGCTP